MGYNLHKNGVLTGCINSFCLVCDILLKSEQEANEHITTLCHKQKLNGVPYSDKFKGEHIRKFNYGYFCEFCNVLLPISAKVTVHINDEKHKQNQGILLIKTEGLSVVAYNNVLIEERAWHGLVEEVCCLCNTEFDDEEEHKKEIIHSLNLVLKPVKFGLDNAISRQIDDSAVQCLTCNTLLAPSAIVKHLNETEHQELYSKRRILSRGIQNGVDIKSPKQNKMPVEEGIQNSTTLNNKNNYIPPNDSQRSKIFESAAKYQSKGININLETDVAFCKKCSQVIKFELMEIENHIENHSSVDVESDLQYPTKLDRDLNRINIYDISKKQTEAEHLNDERDENLGTPNTEQVVDETNETRQETSNASSSSSSTWDRNYGRYNQEAKDFAKANQITFTEENNTSFCRLCAVRLPSSVRSLKEHVAGATHKSNSEKNMTVPSKYNMTKQELRDFIESAYDIEKMFHVDTIVNEKFYLPENSFWLIVKINGRFRCLVCQEYLPPDRHVLLHIQAKNHEAKMESMPIITSEKSEFVREIGPNLFHCGYCNFIVSGWGDMKQHLTCSEHKAKKAYSKIQLQRHLPRLHLFKRQEAADTLRLLWFIRRFDAMMFD